MIKASKLQLGNKIIDQHGDIVSVIKIATGELDLQFEDMAMAGIDPALCDPIPITPEWLERCTFKKDFNISRYFETDNYLIDLNQGQDLSGISVEIKYLHQLQNLYYALTGEELSITL